MDNGGGAMISWTVLSLLRALNIRAKRTIRCVLFTCEEFDHVGGAQYFNDHKDEIPYMSIVMEPNNGLFHPLGLQFDGNNKSREVRKKNYCFFCFDKVIFLDHRNNICTIKVN